MSILHNYDNKNINMCLLHQKDKHDLIGKYITRQYLVYYPTPTTPTTNNFGNSGEINDRILYTTEQIWVVLLLLVEEVGRGHQVKIT